MTPEETLAYKTIGNAVVKLARKGVDDLEIRAALVLHLLQVSRAAEPGQDSETVAQENVCQAAELLRSKGLID